MVIYNILYYYILSWMNVCASELFEADHISPGYAQQRGTRSIHGLRQNHAGSRIIPNVRSVK